MIYERRGRTARPWRWPRQSRTIIIISIMFIIIIISSSSSSSSIMIIIMIIIIIICVRITRFIICLLFDYY